MRWRQIGLVPWKKIAGMGYLGVETAGFGYAPSVAAAKAKFDELGLTVVGAHSGLPLGEQKNQVLETMAALGSDKLICAGTGRELFGSLDAIKERADTFNEVNAIAKGVGLTFGLHNHWWEYAKVDGRIVYDILLEDLDDDIFFEIDTYWVQAAGLDAAAEVAKLNERAPLLHIKDGSTKHEDAMLAVGSGVMDFHKVIPAGSCAEWLIVELDRCDSDMMTAVAESIKYLTQEGLGRARE